MSDDRQWTTPWLKGGEGSGEHPQPDILWRGAAGELDPARTTAIVEHLAGCPACASEWAMALDVQRALPDALGETPPTEGVNRRWLVALTVLAATLALVVLAVPQSPPPTYRDGGTQLSVLSSETLERDALMLRWEAEPDWVYEVQVTDEALEPVFRASDLREGQVRIPPDAVVSGATLLWRVEGVSPSGERRSSRTQTVTVR